MGNKLELIEALKGSIITFSKVDVFKMTKYPTKVGYQILRCEKDLKLKHIFSSVGVLCTRQGKEIQLRLVGSKVMYDKWHPTNIYRQTSNEKRSLFISNPKIKSRPPATTYIDC